MCNSPPPDDDARTSSITNNKKRKQQKQTIVSPLKQPSRKTRTKTRKPKFLSLNLQLSLKKMTHQQQQQQQQLNLFPLHPENLVEDKDIVMHDDHVASFLFDTTTDTTTTLHGLLSTTTTTTTTTTESEGDPLSPSLSYSGHDHDVGSLVRTAMKGKERDESEERWVCYSEVVEKKEEDVDSCGVGVGGEEDHDGSWLCGAKRKSLALKLDYQEILNAWSDKGPLYIERESPQTVPDLHDTANVLRDRWGSVGNLWTVPEMGGNISSIKVKGGKDNWRMGQREASVLRYKEKRQNRLFSKRIRYEVRKLNAEKRPRLKGRFVKRS